MQRAFTSGPITGSILLGLCMGSGAAISMQYGNGEYDKMRQSVFQSFVLIAGMALVLNLLVYLGLDGILWVLRVPEELKLLMKDYLVIIFLGITATFLYNYFANLLRAIGNSVVPLVFLAVSALLNVALDLLCVIVFGWGVKGAAGATVFSQFVSGIGIGIYTLKKFPELCPKREDCRWDKQNLASILNLSVMTSVQQSIMNFGILMVQGLVNSFGTVIMAAFAAAVKIDSFAYMPVQDFGNGLQRVDLALGRRPHLPGQPAPGGNQQRGRQQNACRPPKGSVKRHGSLLLPLPLYLQKLADGQHRAARADDEASEDKHAQHP